MRRKGSSIVFRTGWVTVASGGEVMTRALSTRTGVTTFGPFQKQADASSRGTAETIKGFTRRSSSQFTGITLYLALS
jgi:hypothetical protein